MSSKRVIDHYLVPKHEIVPEDKRAEFLAKLGTDNLLLPKLSKDDPVLEEIGAKKGDIIKITRKSHTAGKAIYFRIVM